MEQSAAQAADLALAIDAAQAAGSILLRHWSDRGRLSVTSKRAGDFLSQADLEAEDCLRNHLLGAHPADGWLGEETAEKTSSYRRWIVDPLDGTTNFLRGIPHWAVSVALEVSGELRVGVVHDPVKHETFSAQFNGGAFLNGERMGVAKTSALSSALFATGIPFGTMHHIDDHAEDIARLMPHCAGVRRFGAAALDLAYVAAGRVDGFWERNLRPWDIGAGLVLLREAGARTESLSPEEDAFTSGTVLTANPILFPVFAHILRGHAWSSPALGKHGSR